MYVMSKLKEIQIIAISSSFYKNVSLLTQVISPSVEFRQHFRKDMFNKPNTVGFLHISHYLSSIYDTKLFKQIVKWPILCKKDESTYRVEIKNFLCLVSRDNPDLCFPSILISHLLQSGGIKFQIIMWKLSQLALRTYMKKELQGELLNAPCTSPIQSLITTYFNNTIAQKCSVMTDTHKKMEKTLKAANNFLNDEIETLNAYKSEIFDRKENIKRLMLDLPANPLIQKRLIDVEDSNIIDLWKKNIFKKVQYIYRKNKEFNELEKSCNYLCKLILRINSNSGTIEANKFPEICCDNCLLYSQCEKHLIRNLYANGFIVFSTLLSLLHLVFVKILHNDNENIENFSDISQCLLFVQNACKKMKSLQRLFNILNTRIDNICQNEQRRSQKINNIDFDTSNVSIANRYLLLQSPKISFNFNEYMDDTLFYERLWLPSSPMEGKYRHLFKRHKQEYRPLCELSATLLDLSKSWNNMSGWLSPRVHSVKSKVKSSCEQILFKRKPLPPLYSRLLHHSKLDLKHSRENVSHNPSMNYEGLNLTPKKRPLQAKHLISKMRNLFSSPS
ncbi:PREDICTED: uncharacterized protein LOC108747210 [Trachymyrmex septentrionalis]|uniref:uncharacterized protein LOC108747210 n=1 Tax=Trachymyrmex septentrionalis TaxID=34720 RepID=UPI00084F5B29|nr:PREDICTED: uncharacterized protein LOC108747210 [Trachymyrmex septentrionalis]